MNIKFDKTIKNAYLQMVNEAEAAISDNKEYKTVPLDFAGTDAITEEGLKKSVEQWNKDFSVTGTIVNQKGPNGHPTVSFSGSKEALTNLLKKDFEQDADDSEFIDSNIVKG